MSTELIYEPATLTVSAVMDGYLCPVCGNTLSSAPAHFTICPCCGTEFGNDDQDWSYEQLRSAWLDKGAQWWSQANPAPDNWNPIVQVLGVIRLEGIGDFETNTIFDAGELFQVGGPGGIWVTWKLTTSTES